MKLKKYLERKETEKIGKYFRKPEADIWFMTMIWNYVFYKPGTKYTF